MLQRDHRFSVQPPAPQAGPTLLPPASLRRWTRDGIEGVEVECRKPLSGRTDPTPWARICPARGLTTAVSVEQEGSYAAVTVYGPQGQRILRSPSAEAAAAVALPHSQVRVLGRGMAGGGGTGAYRSHCFATLAVHAVEDGCVGAPLALHWQARVIQFPTSAPPSVPRPTAQASSSPLGSSPQGSFESEWLAFMSTSISHSRSKQRRRSQRGMGGPGALRAGQGWGRGGNAPQGSTPGVSA